MFCDMLTNHVGPGINYKLNLIFLPAGCFNSILFKISFGLTAFNGKYTAPVPDELLRGGGACYSVCICLSMKFSNEIAPFGV